MMAQKRLDELLREDQEPFQLKSYIADRRSQLRPTAQTQLQLKKRKPISETPNFPGKFCKNACFFSFHDSPDLRKSPLFDFASPAAKSPCRSPKNAIFLHIPARTTALLVEAALRIQKQSKANTTQTPKTPGFGLFGSILKRLTNRSRSHRKREIGAADKKVKVSVKDILRWDSSVGRSSKISDQRENYRKSGRYSCNGSSPSSAIWSETNEEKSPEDLETPSSSQSYRDSPELFVCKDINSIDDFAFCDSPFRFVLQRSPSTGRRTPEFLSPAASPRRNKTEDKEKYDVESLKKLQAGGEEEEEEEKEQCSPVSVLDAPFEDDDDGHDEEDEEHNESFDIEGSYAIVQRAKQQLLQKLRRFEKLAELDPIELEKRMLENDEEDDQEDQEELDSETSEDQEFDRTSFHQDWQIPKYMRLLVSDLMAEEDKQETESDDQEVMKKVLNRLESWKDVESNTIDMMVEQDFRREFGLWNKNQEQVEDTAAEIELAIFGLLVEELWS